MKMASKDSNGSFGSNEDGSMMNPRRGSIRMNQGTRMGGMNNPSGTRMGGMANPSGMSFIRGAMSSNLSIG